MYKKSTKYQLREGKKAGIMIDDVTANITYPEAANQKGILSVRKILSLPPCSVRNVELPPPATANRMAHDSVFFAY